jgi:EmrB/QacA subfamily drug resistance transporter
MEPARLRVVALIVAAAMFMHNLDSTLIATSLPQIAASFGRPAIDLSIGITAFILATAALLPMSGWLGDRFGERDMFVWAVALFTLASIVCAAANSLALFVAGRVLQGMAGALIATVGRTLVLRHASGRQLLTAIALITWPGLLAPVIAPVLGGMITTYSTWRWNFLLNLPLGIVVCALAWKLVPVASHHEHRSLDLPGLLYSSLAMFGLLYGLEGYASAHGSTAAAPWLWSIVGAVSLWLMFRHLRRARAPLFDLAVLTIPTFSLTNGKVAVFFRASISATPFLLPLMLQLAYGLSALAAGTYIMIYFLGNVAMKPATSPLLRAFGFRRVLVLNGCISGLATIACGFVSPAQSLWLAAPVLFLTGLARSMQFTCLNTLSFADVAPGLRSSGTTLHTMLLQVSTAIGVAVSALVLQKSAALAGRAAAGLTDFRIAFLVAGVAGLISALCYLRLERDAGAAVVS